MFLTSNIFRSVPCLESRVKVYVHAADPHVYAEGLHTCAALENNYAEGLHTCAALENNYAEGLHTCAALENNYAEGLHTCAAPKNNYAEGLRFHSISEIQSILTINRSITSWHE